MVIAQQQRQFVGRERLRPTLLIRQPEYAFVSRGVKAAMPNKMEDVVRLAARAAQRPLQIGDGLSRQPGYVNSRAALCRQRLFHALFFQVNV